MIETNDTDALIDRWETRLGHLARESTGSLAYEAGMQELSRCIKELKTCLSLCWPAEPKGSDVFVRDQPVEPGCGDADG